MIKDFKLSRTKQYITYMLLAIFFIQSIVISAEAIAAEYPEAKQVYNEQIAREILFQANNLTNTSGHPISEYIITADLNDPTVEIITAKASDKVLKLGTVSSQIASEQSKGQNVVAGINGDMFNISLGTTHYGAPLGLQVKDGQILVGFETLGSETRYPVFAIDKNNKPMITYVAMDNYLTAIDTDSPEAIIDIDTINRNNTEVMDNKMILITPHLADKPVVGFTDAQANNAVFAVLKNIKGANDGSVRLGQKYEAQVAEVHYAGMNLKSMTVPKDGMILAAQGVKADWVKEHLKAEDKVRFSFNLNDKAGHRLEIKEAVTAWLPLVKNGRALTKEDMLEICKNDWDRGTATINAMDKGRTALGFTRDNKVVALAIDGGGARSNSYGIDLPDIAARLQELGVVAAVSLDGGGSTQMNTRLFGETDVNVINQPSDAKERPVSNTILFISNAPKTNDVNELKVNHDITIFKNTAYAFQVRGQDSNKNPVDLSKMDIKWSIKLAAGVLEAQNNSSIDEKGLFTAGSLPGQVAVVASLGSVESQAKVNVVDKVDILKFTESGVIGVEPHVSKQLQINAFTQEGQPMVISDEAIEWSVTPASLAYINEYGLFTPLGQGNGTIKAKVGEQEAVLNFVAGQESQLIESYEMYDPASYYIDGYIGGQCEVSTEPVKDGMYSLKVDYDYVNWDKVYNGTINVKRPESAAELSYTSNIRPKKLGMWVYGDGKAPWLRAMIKDGQQNAHTLNLASRIDWIGWKYVTVDIPADIPMPITLDYFYMVETDKSKNWSGAVYFDDVRFLYY